MEVVAEEKEIKQIQSIKQTQRNNIDDKLEHIKALDRIEDDVEALLHNAHSIILFFQKVYLI